AASRRRQRDPGPADLAADLAAEEEADEPPVAAQRESRRQRAGEGWDEGGVGVGGQPAREFGAGGRARRRDVAPLTQEPRQPGEDFEDRLEFLAAPAGCDRDRDQRQLGRDQGRGDQDQEAGRVDPDQERPAVALEPAPLVLAGAELVLVVDDRGGL